MLKHLQHTLEILPLVQHGDMRLGQLPIGLEVTLEAQILCHWPANIILVQTPRNCAVVVLISTKATHRHSGQFIASFMKRDHSTDYLSRVAVCSRIYPWYADADVGGWHHATTVVYAIRTAFRLENAADRRIDELPTINNGDVLDAVALRGGTGSDKAGEEMAYAGWQSVDESEVVEA
jgi:hypothetical protein